MTNKETQEKLQILRSFLKEQDIPERRYSIGEYCDESICIEKDGDNWVVYAGDRGNHYEEMVFSEFYDAACHLLSRIAYSHNEEESLAKAFKAYLNENESIKVLESNNKVSFFSLFTSIFEHNVKNNYYKTRSFHLVKPILILLTAMIITSLITYYITFRVTYRSTIHYSELHNVRMMSHRFVYIKETDTFEEAINKLSTEYENQNEEIADLNSQIIYLSDELKAQQNSDAKEKEIERLKDQLSKKEQELADKQDEFSELQEEFNELQYAGYEEYIRSKTFTPYVFLKDIEILKNEGINIRDNGDATLNGTSYAYYMDTNSLGEAYIEYKLDGEYSLFEGKVYIPKWVYEEYDNNDVLISNVLLSIAVKYENDDNYQEIAQLSGLSADSEPVVISGSVLGASSLRITIKDGAGMRGDNLDSIIRLGDPILHKYESQSFLTK